MRNISKLLCALLCLVICAAGCSLGNDGGETTAATTAESTAATTTATTTAATTADDGIPALLKTNLDALAEKDPDELLRAQDKTARQPFDAIVALGEKALPYLEALADAEADDPSWFPDISIAQRVWALNAIYAIKPETYDLIFPSPDGKYSVRLLVASFASYYYSCN